MTPSQILDWLMRTQMPKSVDEVIGDSLAHAYDPQKAHEYYLRVRKLKGRKGSGEKPGAKVIPLARKAPSHQVSPALQAQVDQLKSRLSTLQTRLREILQNQRESGKKSGDKTASEKSEDARNSKKYRDKHKAELAQKRKSASSKSGGGEKTSVGSMSETEVRAAIARTRSNLQAAVAKARAAANRGTA